LATDIDRWQVLSSKTSRALTVFSFAGAATSGIALTALSPVSKPDIDPPTMTYWEWKRASALGKRAFFFSAMRIRTNSALPRRTPHQPLRAVIDGVPLEDARCTSSGIDPD
jgi:hypothetical protein